MMDHRSDNAHRSARVLAVAGSLRDGSTNSSVLATVRAVAPADVEVRVYSRLADLPHFDPDLDRPGSQAPVEVERLRAAIAASDAVLFSTPEYAGALPGALKNLLEWTIGSSSLGQLPVAWINPSTAPTGATLAHASLRTVLGYTGARIVEEACADLPVPRGAIETGQVVDESLRAELRTSLMSLVGSAMDLADRRSCAEADRSERPQLGGLGGLAGGGGS